jgi:hypothetical protein
MLTIKPNLYPADGYRFKETDGTIFRGPNWNSVLKQVVAYRERAKLPKGDPLREITEQACARQPAICFDDQGRVAPKTQLSLKSKCLKWLNGFFQAKEKGESLAFVSAGEAEKRAEICRACPANHDLNISGCSSCKQSFAEFRKGILESRVQLKGVHGCGVLAVDLKVAVHLDEIRIDNPNLPAVCWRKKAL